MSKTPSDALSTTLHNHLEQIIRENQQLAEKLDFDQVAAILPLLQQANRVFVVGAGRTGLALKAAAMRLMHLGLTVFVVGETTTPAIGSGDVLLAGSGSGTTSSIVKAAEKAAAAGARVVAISTTTSSPLAALATHVAVLPAAQKQDHGGEISAQYAGSLFEQSVLLLLDAIFQTLWGLDGTPAEELWKRHANLE
ncbi:MULTISPECIES: 6-phospho-3-hexuloisomerase [Hymenobacter]|uniref:6-phospho-3-hexuloisomerase n=2 Tax=Hymenobacter TaxID=89966 RepID=A0ABS6WTP3_9BACT|nr:MULTISPECIES: 6-phospho-3-hexuloisomerase [Hymenobacter]MBO3269593.1 6-phospho-3-hexuloisomerase [Hymenobacter defluvii]MBW3126954.1 6-phospho-3-hexuloisomerase [Hymenobacter profundi]MBW3127055.1 6-phospho-3-hexuloisomerase [Hymenobacter profundi]QNE39263.1 6-phospho-3-hexuloisomerase [Hymenobacter sp. NBH84]